MDPPARTSNPRTKTTGSNPYKSVRSSVLLNGEMSTPGITCIFPDRLRVQGAGCIQVLLVRQGVAYHAGNETVSPHYIYRKLRLPHMLWMLRYFLSAHAGCFLDSLSVLDFVHSMRVVIRFHCQRGNNMNYYSIFPCVPCVGFSLAWSQRESRSW